MLQRSPSKEQGAGQMKGEIKKQKVPMEAIREATRRWVVSAGAAQV